MRITHALDSYKATGVGCTAKNATRLKLQSGLRISKLVNYFAQGWHAAMDKEHPETNYGDLNLQDRKWLFASRMGRLARRRLVEQGIYV